MEREQIKSVIWVTYSSLSLLILALGSLIPLQLEFGIASGIILSLWVSALFTSSYILALHYAWDRTGLFYGLVVGGIPVRMGLGLLSSAVILSIPQVNQGVYVFSLMGWWVVFTAIEFGMALEYWHKVGQVKPIIMVKGTCCGKVG